MSSYFIAPKSLHSTGLLKKTFVEVPKGYSTKARWIPKIGDYFPNFWAETTDEPISFHYWAEGSWTFLFSHPCAFTPICTTELAEFAMIQSDLEERGVKTLGMTNSRRDDEARWIREVEQTFDVKVNFPIISDPEHELSKIFGIYQQPEHEGFTVRRSFLIDPSLRLRMLFEYPAQVGRSTDELLRAIDGLQMVDKTNLGMPADWSTGSPCVIPPSVSDSMADELYGEHWKRISPNLRVTNAT